ncbi:inner membrane protein YhjD [Nocardioides fonticola]|uniref:Inner membrane protein YhjD n=1 Tax=Nocardioides fonticola TaxID=450363 RepID=A0ABP7XF39_9ACTN
MVDAAPGRLARVKERLARLRERHPVLDHVIRMQERYGATGASQQAGAVTYFGFLSFFPVLALAFFTVGVVSHIYPDADDTLTSALDSVLPGLLSGSDGISLDDIRTFSGLAGVVGLLGVLYSGLGWLSALRSALEAVFETPPTARPGFLAGKLRDLATLLVLGLVLFVSVPVAGFVGGFSGDLLDAVGLDSTFGWVVRLLTVLLGLAANAVLFFAMFRLLAAAAVPPRSLWSGAALGAVLFEVLKQAATLLFAATTGSPAFQAFGVALILLVWINYFSRLVLYAAAWAATTAEARAAAPEPVVAPVHGPPLPSGPDAARSSAEEVPPWRSFAVGTAVGAVAGALVGRRRA